jgi:hypothetical protein
VEPAKLEMSFDMVGIELGSLLIGFVQQNGIPDRAERREMDRIRWTGSIAPPFLPAMQILPRLLAIAALALLVPACAHTPKKANCCSAHKSSSKTCTAGDAQCHVNTGKMKTN